MGVRIDAHHGGLWATKLYWSSGRRRVCDGLYINALPGTMTAVMGPSGCGKSAFLSILTGYIKPNKGKVFLFDQNVHKGRQVLRRIGFVPQAEVMIPELTVGVSLDYRIRFYNSKLTAQQRKQRCRDVFRLVGFSEDEIDVKLKNQIGAPEWRGQYPSGGERRRINTAHELLADPDVLMMDEPTSGLDSATADSLVRQMSEIAIQQRIPVLMTIHQPSRETYERFDDLLVIAPGGKIAYYGSREHATEYFQRIATSMDWDPDMNPVDTILGLIRIPQVAVSIVNEFSRNCGHADYPYLKPPREQACVLEGVS